MMIQRCTNPHFTKYPSYGGAGVKVCDRWRLFDVFWQDMGERPSLEHTLDRYPDRRGNYEPGNVRWATRWEQGHNRSDLLLLMHNGKTQCLNDWARELGVNREALKARLNRGWTVDRALSVPIGMLRGFIGWLPRSARR